MRDSVNMESASIQTGDLLVSADIQVVFIY
jgi:hypothetical protein